MSVSTVRRSIHCLLSLGRELFDLLVSRLDVCWWWRDGEESRVCGLGKWPTIDGRDPVQDQIEFPGYYSILAQGR